MTETADVIVIGGGIAGVGVAAHLGTRARVLLLEAESQPGYHASGRSAAMYLKNYGNATVKALTRAGEPYFRAPPSEVSDAPLLSERGIVWLAAPEEVTTFGSHLAASPEAVEITAAEAAAMFPVLRTDRVARAAHEADAPDIDAARLLQGWTAATRRHGRIETSAPVTAIARIGSAWRVETPALAAEAPVVINAAGAWADRVAALAGVPPVGLVPCRRSAALLPAPAGHDVSRWPLVVTVSETWYAKPDAGRLMVSPADEDPVEPHDAWADDMVLAEGLDRFTRATTMTVDQVLHTWAGLRTFAPDRTPIAGFDPAAPGFFWLAGQGGYGIQTAPALSGLSAALALGETPDAALAPLAGALSPARFRIP